ncbi:hypothetical protein EV182_001440 [Spiromyces aspiralis]|uniref:Uncharacterized protein n=1 Tax=Spiromyces aspiralis TaxID=68401 RepID=A0ACC1HN55_9FUNG|nr:hypothetical protein EV182_001440 [Spiromyces aspiralis]
MVHAVTGAGYSLQNVAFGMGGGLLQKVNRDTMSFATKISSIVYRDGTVRDMMKFPKSNKEKTSLPGEFVVRGGGDSGMPPIVYHARATDPESWKAAGSANQLRVVYDNGPVGDSEKGPWEGETFDRLRERVRSQWDAYPPLYNAVSTPLGQYQRQVHEAQLERLYAQSEPSSKMRD